MELTEHYFAVDLGATSGRTIVGHIEGGQLLQQELTRFDNKLIETGGHVYWDLANLYNEIIKGLKLAHDKELTISSIGIDTWGCDFVLFDKNGKPLHNPLAYRDPYTVGMMERFFERVMPKEQVYGKTGIQLMNFNSLFQLYAMRETGMESLVVADKILFIPDALSYMLTGGAVCEYTVASTSELLNPVTRELDGELLNSVGVKREQMGRMVFPGTVIGTLRKEVQQLTGLGEVPVVAVAGHDTASAVAAVPAKDGKFAYLSSGTWSLMGIELAKPVITDESFALNFTNEGGVDGTTRFLKNICGMWLYERCRKEWKEENPSDADVLEHGKLQADAMKEEAFRSLINPDAQEFANPVSMVEAIKDYCKHHNEPIPDSKAQICRCIFDSLALRYGECFRSLSSFAPFKIETLHIIGGGSLNRYLNQMTANACGVTVLAGPQEATAIGNIMLQAKARGRVNGMADMRKVIAESIQLERFEPQNTELWARAYEKYQQITQ